MSSVTTTCDSDVLREKARAALYGLFVGDASAMPTHWYYNRDNIYKDFGKECITKYADAKHPHPEAFMIGEKYLPNIKL